MHQIFRPATLTISVKIILRARNTGAGFDVPEMTSRMWQNKNHSSCAAKEREIKSIMGIRVNPAIKFMMSPWGTCWACPACHIKKDCQSVKSSAQTPGKQYSSSTAVTSCPCLPKEESQQSFRRVVQCTCP